LTELLDTDWIIEIHRSWYDLAGQAIDRDQGGEWVTSGIFHDETAARSVYRDMHPLMGDGIRVRSVTELMADRRRREERGEGRTCPDGHFHRGGHALPWCVWFYVGDVEDGNL
jgi:hypothetical protein